LANTARAAAVGDPPQLSGFLDRTKVVADIAKIASEVYGLADVRRVAAARVRLTRTPGCRT
jgi:hypothetical protein